MNHSLSERSVALYNGHGCYPGCIIHLGAGPWEGTGLWEDAELDFIYLSCVVTHLED